MGSVARAFDTMAGSAKQASESNMAPTHLPAFHWLGVTVFLVLLACSPGHTKPLRQEVSERRARHQARECSKLCNTAKPFASNRMINWNTLNRRILASNVPFEVVNLKDGSFDLTASANPSNTRRFNPSVQRKDTASQYPSFEGYRCGRTYGGAGVTEATLQRRRMHCRVQESAGSSTQQGPCYGLET